MNKRGRVTNNQPVIIRADIEHLRPVGDEEGEQEGSAILWLCGVLFVFASAVILMGALFVALQAVAQ